MCTVQSSVDLVFFIEFLLSLGGQNRNGIILYSWNECTFLAILVEKMKPFYYILQKIEKLIVADIHMHSHKNAHAICCYWQMSTSFVYFILADHFLVWVECFLHQFSRSHLTYRVFEWVETCIVTEYAECRHRDLYFILINFEKKSDFNRINILYDFVNLIEQNIKTKP